MGFNFPRPPLHTIVPGTAQTAADIGWGALALISLALILLECRRARSPLPMIVLIGGAVAYLNEPIVDVLGLVWHPRIHQERVVNTFGPLPLWGLFCYVVFFGAATYLFLAIMRRGVTRRQFWIGVGALMVVNLGIEIPLLPTHLYYYYGYHTPPMTLAHLPLYWLFLNVGGPLLAAAILFGGAAYFTGVRMLVAVLVPMTSYACWSLAAGWPIFTALHAPHLAQPLVWVAAALTIVISALMLDRIALFVQSRTTSAGNASPASEPSMTKTRAPSAAPAHV